MEEIGGAGSEDIEEEAVLGDRGAPEGRGRLRAVIGKVRGLERLEPGSVGNRRTPAEIAYRRRGIRDAEEFVDAGRRDSAANGTAEGEDQRALLLGMGERRHGAKKDSGEENRKSESLRLTRFHGVPSLTWEKSKDASVRGVLLAFRRSAGRRCGG